MLKQDDNSIYLNNKQLVSYTSENMKDKCFKCDRIPKYLNTESKQIFCWFHSIE